MTDSADTREYNEYCGVDDTQELKARIRELEQLQDIFGQCPLPSRFAMGVVCDRLKDARQRLRQLRSLDAPAAATVGSQPTGEGDHD